MTGLERHARRRLAVRLHRAGHTPAQIAPHVGLAPSSVRWLLWREGERPHTAPRVPDAPTPRPVRTSRIITTLRAVGRPVLASELAMEIGPPEDYRRVRDRCSEQLARLYRGGRVSRLYCPGRTYQFFWTLPELLPMTLEAAQDMIRRGVPFPTAEAAADPGVRAALREWYVREPGIPNLAARDGSGPPPARPEVSSDLCTQCGGFMVRTGTCLTCQSCGGSSGGCG